ncbi:MAG: radical SAM protein [Planctomycetes bacterium]|nr:radical SAM protein [Planctomycetota bacterium]
MIDLNQNFGGLVTRLRSVRRRIEEFGQGSLIEVPTSMENAAEEHSCGPKCGSKKAKLEPLKVPRYLWLEVSNRCDFACKMCYNWKNGDTLEGVDRMSLAQVETIFDSLRGKVEPNFEVSFTGSEPTLNPELPEFIRAATDRGLRTTFPTHAFNLTEDYVKNRLRGTGLSTVMISCDGATEVTHDSIRKVPGSFKQIFTAIGLLKKYIPDVNIGILSTIMAYNYREAPELVKLVQSDPRIDWINFQAVTQPFGLYETKGESRQDEDLPKKWFEHERFAHLWPEPDIVDSVDEILELRKDGKVGSTEGRLNEFKMYYADPDTFLKNLDCSIGNFGFHVTITGDVFFCFYWDKLGHVPEDDLIELWNSPQALKVRESISTCTIPCDLVMNCRMDG